MRSFVACGHPVELHAYDQIKDAPSGVSLADAGRTIPSKDLFRHPKTGSLAPFADWFRYRILHARGGVWADTDVVCLRPLQYANAELYAWQDESQINNAVLGLPAGHELAEWMAECCAQPNRFLPYDDARTKRRKLRRRFLQGNRRGNVKWGEYGPGGFTSAARYLGYDRFAIGAEHFYPLPYSRWREAFVETTTDWRVALSASRALHLWNEMMRRERTFDKNTRFPRSSLFETLCAKYEVE